MPSKLAVITGASKGIGRATALALGGEDLEIVVTARNTAQLEEVRNEITQKNGHCIPLVADLNSAEEVAALGAKIGELKKPLALLVHSAGVAKVGGVSDMDFADWQETLHVNLTVPFLLTQKLSGQMQNGGHIIFVNSVAGTSSFSDWSAYCASKAGLKAFADTLRQEWQPRGIKVTSIYPTSVDTPLQDKLPYDWDRSKMLSSAQVAQAILSCYHQEKNVLIKNLEVENLSGTF